MGSALVQEEYMVWSGTVLWLLRDIFSTLCLPPVVAHENTLGWGAWNRLELHANPCGCAQKATKSTRVIEVYCTKGTEPFMMVRLKPFAGMLWNRDFLAKHDSHIPEANTTLPRM